MPNSINLLAVRSVCEEDAREQLIRSQEQTILRTASAACRRFVTKSDDEWSVSLCAFSRAIDIYREDRGDFLPFAQMLIRHDLIDYFRSQKRGLREISVAPHVLEVGGDPEEDGEGVYLAVIRSSTAACDRSLHEETVSANEMFRNYGFRFYDLTSCSPQQERSRAECARAIRFLLSRPDLTDELERTHKLPVRTVSDGSGVSRKALDRYRKYIIMAVLILNGDYPQLSEYLKFVKEEA